jgi:peptide/nickel transport system ATP-binding protein
VEQFGTAAIYITHDLAVVAQMADRIKVLLRGEEVEEAPTREMLATAREDYTKSLWAVRSFARPERRPPRARRSSRSGASRRLRQGHGPARRELRHPPGRTVAVVGESGSGKSTVARVITGLLPPERARSCSRAPPAPDFRDRTRPAPPVPDDLPDGRHRAEPEAPAPRDHRAARRRCISACTASALDARVRELLALIELEPDRYIDRLPGELSGGQKQRIGIARALAAEPEAHHLRRGDERARPDRAGGDPEAPRPAPAELGLAYMFITHDLATVKAIADEVVVMQHGRVVEQGPKAEMFAPPHAPYTELLLSSVPEMDPDWLTRLLAARRA